MSAAIVWEEGGLKRYASVAPNSGLLVSEVAVRVVPQGATWFETSVMDAQAQCAEWIAQGSRESMTLSFAQLLIGLVTEAWITEAEGEAWLAGTLPNAVLLVIDSLPADQRFAAKARALRPSEVLRNDPLVAAMGTAAGKTSAQIDAFFQTYAQV